MASQHSLLRSGSMLSLLTLASRVLGLLREMTKAALLGTGPLSDAFTVAFMLPNLFRRLFAEGSIAVAFIPTFKEYLIADKYQETRDFLCAFWTLLTFIVSVATAAGIVLAPFLVPFFKIEALDEAALLTRVMFPYLLFISIAAFFQGILNSVHSFIPSALGPLLLNTATIGAAWLLSPLMANPARAMAAGIFVGGLLEAAVQAPFVFKRRFFFSWTGLIKAFRNPGTQKVLCLIGPTIIGMAAYQLNDVVSTALAGKTGGGVVSSLQYSLRLQELILGVFAVSIGTVLLPQLAEEAKTARWDAYNQRLSDAVSVIALITLPVVFFSLSQGEALIRLLFQTREFNEQSVALTKEAFMFHIAGLFFIALNRIIAPAFYAQSDSFSPTMAGLISFGVNILLAFLLAPLMRGAGIALALSVAGAVNTLFLMLFLGKNKRIAVRHITGTALRYILKMIVFSLIAIVPVELLSDRSYLFFAENAPRHKIFSLALPLALHFFLFAGTGAALLILSRDKYLGAIRLKLKRKT